MSTETTPAATMRTTENYNIWRLVLINHPRFASVLKETVERQKRDPIASINEEKKRNVWLPLKKDQQYKSSTIQEFQSLLLKIIYCLIDEPNLTNYGWYNVDREMDSLYKGQSLMDIEEFIERLLILGGINKKRMQATINFYTRSLNLPDYKIPANVELPKDRERRNRLLNNKKIDLVDDLIGPVRRFIENEIQHKNYYTNQSLVRGAIAFNIIQGTGLRITNAYQIKLSDLIEVYNRGEYKVNGLIIKHSKVDFCYVKCVDKRALKMAIDMYQKVPVDTLNKISSKSPTRFQDIKCLFEKVYGEDKKQFTSNMIRNFVADSLLNRGVSFNKTSRLMNHSSLSATRFYVNKFHAGPSMLADTDEDTTHTIIQHV
ncbi:very late factor-1 [Erinnyis ello granulovirus]|uniref:Very late factor-1 n=1 Tax=Erinnyis ello granulovirus TaxID=307444 RepID=A0A097DAT3_9BBAC|nr:very late factor-1 [Erinnyis ello granulovirus]AIS92098.1 very late factor-1 [Erinnyis ello granulovirus]ARX71438.1 very late factor-1 [Erinnyis ello granulovirus]ARX71568.1 very late factor-1 [Erinnyis ello granulovirus]ARX71698.1 very late factor-1 [Erinnyis ello granulovirus]ARX71828.1 very late factor-1 [Erinnyis ello granulovirus]